MGGACRPDSPASSPVLLIHGYAQNRYTFHHPTRSLAAHLASRGRDAYVVELRGHGRSRGAPWPRGFHDYLDLDLPALVAAALAHSAAAQVILMGHSLGGLLAQLYAGTRPEEVAGVCTLAAPSHRLRKGRLFRAPLVRGATRITLELRDRGLASRVRKVAPGFALDRIGRVSFAVNEHLWPRLPLRLRGGRRNPLMPVYSWNPGSFEPAMERDRLRKGFDRTGLGVTGDFLEWAARGRVPGAQGERNLLDRLGRVTCPTLLLASPDDDIIPAKIATHPEDLPKAPVTAHHLPGFGHCDLVLGHAAPAEVWPIIDEWLEQILIR